MAYRYKPCLAEWDRSTLCDLSRDTPRRARTDIYQHYEPLDEDNLDERESSSDHLVWVGNGADMIRVPRAYTSAREDNIFDFEKLAAVRDAVANKSGERLYFHAPYAQAMRISEDEVALSQQTAARETMLLFTELGVTRPFTTGDDELDEYLLDKDEFLIENASRSSRALRSKMARAMESRLVVASKLPQSDLGKLWVRLRDGHHRVFGAFMAGETWAWVTRLRDHHEAWL